MAIWNDFERNIQEEQEEFERVVKRDIVNFALEIYEDLKMRDLLKEDNDNPVLELILWHLNRNLMALRVAKAE